MQFRKFAIEKVLIRCAQARPHKIETLNITRHTLISNTHKNIHKKTHRCVHSSKSTDLTNVICTPICRCAAEQSKHRNIPYVVEAHVGRVLGQSKHIVLAGIFFSFRNWLFLSLVGIHTCPLPAAVIEPSAWMLPEWFDIIMYLLLLLMAVRGGNNILTEPPPINSASQFVLQ